MSRTRVQDEVILAAVREVVAEHGPHVSTQTVADRLGLSEATLFKRFGTKEALFVCALLPGPDEALERQIASGPLRGFALEPQLAEIARLLQAKLADVMPRIQALHAVGYAGVGEQPATDSAIHRGIRAVTAWFERAKDQGLVRADIDAAATAKAFLGALFFDAHIARLGGHLASRQEGYAEVVVTVLCRGLVP